ncbi:hypothetical protein [Paenibacillus donghaensis]|uniref:Uncharacterized protein n=1 Tax=Paenibacillus donghaensis TaxID=414771 RepID=A0A2Z2KDF3_9BACL|nr:hypothetical protein [Paenibacillus donghaensis]ASA21825.1 hypothetical protein B9T62_14205 [Paenibacillus donghaensis]
MSLDETKKVKVRNLCTWDLYVARIESNGDFRIAAKKSVSIPVAEIIAQVNEGNRIFAGDDEKGTNARVYIEDEEVRAHLGFDSEDTKEKQEVLTEDEIVRIINLKTFSSFKENVEKKVLHQFQKALLMEVAIKNKLNDLAKVQFIEEYTELKFEK